MGRKSTIEKMLDKVLIGDDCWEWIGKRSGNGYGLITGDRPRELRAHRVIYEEFVGPVPDGLDLDHLCRNRACVRPDHLEPVTRAENACRGLTGKVGGSAAAVNKQRTHCKHGHPFDEANTYVIKDVGRQCKTCCADRTRRYRAEKKAASSVT